MTDRSEIERVYREVGDRLWWALLAYTGDRELASDAVAEAFALALTSVDRIRDPAAWVWRVGFRVATANLRAARRTTDERERSYEMDEEAIDVVQALRRLPPRQRAVAVLFYLEDQPTARIAQILGMATATVSVHLYRARRTLRSLLEDAGG